MVKTLYRKKKCRKLLLCISALLLTVLLLGTSVFAEEYDPSAKGSFSLTLVQKDQDGNETSFPGVGISLYKVGDTVYDTGAITFTIDESFASANLDMSQQYSASEWAQKAQDLASLVKDSSLTPVSKLTDGNGSLSFTDLEQGVYLLVQNNMEDKYTVAPMLLTLPYYENEEWNLEVTAFPKLSLVPTQAPTPKPNTPVDTGDTSSLFPWQAAFLAACAGALLIGFAIKKRH